MKDIILVGVDGSSTSRRALDWAIAEAEIRKWPLRLVSSVSPALVADPLLEASYLEVVERESLLILNEFKERANVRGIDAEMILAYGNAGGVLVKHSENVGLAVVGKRGRSGFAGRLLGSVSSGLAAHSKCPTVVVPEGWSDDATADSVRSGDGSGGSSFAGRIAIAVDFGLEDPTLWEGADVAQRHGKPLTLVLVRAPILGDFWAPTAHAADEYHGEATRELERVVGAVQARYPEMIVDGQVLIGEPPEVLVSVTNTADLLILGTRGHGGFPGLLLGSVSQAVLHHGHSPMMVVPRSWRYVSP